MAKLFKYNETTETIECEQLEQSNWSAGDVVITLDGEYIVDEWKNLRTPENYIQVAVVSDPRNTYDEYSEDI